MHRSALTPCSLEALRMRDSAARGHPVHLAGPNHLLDPDRVAVHDLPGEHIRHGRETYVRVRSHIGVARQTFRQLDGAQVVEEYEGPHHVVVRMGQYAAHLESSETAPSLIDQHHGHEPRGGCVALSRGPADPRARRGGGCQATTVP